MAQDPNRQKGFPVIVLANWYQFGPGQRIAQPCIYSRMMLWCKTGRGTVQSCGQTMDLCAGRFALLPWGRRMVYQADTQMPFLLAGVHWIPQHRAGVRIAFEVAHSRQHPLADVPWRRDSPLGTWRQEAIVGDLVRAPALHHLGEYIVARYTGSGQNPPEMRQLAGLLVTEVLRLLTTGAGESVSAELLRVQQFVRDRLGRRLTVDDLAAFAGCSRATLLRLFRHELHISPAAWVAKTRIAGAQELLRSTHLPIQAVARRVGIADPYYFSRVFRRQVGLAPRKYRAAALPL
jgi:AraC-like DNA-binding protein